MPRIALEGVDLWVEEHGAADGPPVLLLHGLGSAAADWTPQIAAFAGRHRVLALDLRGHGRSRPARGPLTVDGFAADVARVLEVLGAPPAHVVGLSLGGCVGLALAAGHAARVRSLTVVNGFARLAPAGLRGRLRALHRLALACIAPMPVVAAQVAGTLFPRPEQRDRYDAARARLAGNSRRAYVGSMLALARFDARARLAAVRCPTLVVVGEGDRTVPRAAATVLGRGIAGARLCVVRDSGHATPYDQPDVFNRAVLEFIGGVS